MKKKARKSLPSRTKSQQGKLPVPAILAAGIAILLVGFFLFSSQKQGNKQPSGTSQTQTQSSTPLLSTDVLALGGTCFTTAFEDATGDAEGQKDGSFDKITTDNGSYDLQRITVGIEGTNLVMQWDMEGSIPADAHHNIRFWTYHDTDALDDDRIELAWAAADKRWVASLRPGSGETQEFDPHVQIYGSSARFLIPVSLIAPSGTVDGLAFTSFVYDKATSTSYTDSIVPTRDSSRTGHFTTFYCPR